MLVNKKLMEKFTFRAQYLILAVFFLFFIGIPVSNVSAGVMESLLVNSIGSLLNLFIMFIGWMSTLATYLLLQIAQYNNFINEPIVVEVWTILRDFANMGFVVILLWTAFSIILHLGKFELEKQLPKIAIMAVVINYSRSLCAVVLDPIQLVMLSFFSVLSGGNGSNLVNAMGMDKLFSMEQVVGTAANAMALLASQIFGLVLLVTALILIIAYTLALMMRVVKLWIYVIFSPVAALSYAIPNLEGEYRKWKDGFINTAVCGVYMAFYLWFALLVGQPRDGFLQGVGMEGGGYIAGFLNSIVNGTGIKHLVRFIFVNMLLAYGLAQSSKKCGDEGGFLKWGKDMMGKTNAKGMQPVNNATKWAGDKLGAWGGALGDGIMNTGKGTLRLGDRLLGTGFNKAAGLTPVGAKFTGLEQKGLFTGTAAGVWDLKDKAKKWTGDKLASNRFSAIRRLGQDSLTNKALLAHQRAGIEIEREGIASYRDKRYKKHNNNWYRVNAKNEWVNDKDEKIGEADLNESTQAKDEAGANIVGNNMNKYAPIIDRDGQKMRWNHHTNSFAHVDGKGEFINEQGRSIADMYGARQSFKHVDGKQYHILGDNRVVDDTMNEVSKVITEGDEAGGFEMNGRTLFVHGNMIEDGGGARHGKIVDVNPNSFVISGVDSAGQTLNSTLSSANAALYTAFRDSFSVTNAANVAAQNKVVEGIMKDFAKHTTGELRNIVDAMSSSVNEKMAGYQALAEQGALRTNDEVKSARVAMSGNQEALKKLNDTIRSKQVDKAYDLASSDPEIKRMERRRLASDISKDIIKTSQLPDGAWKSKEFVEVLRQELGGRVFGDRVKKAYDEADDDLRGKITTNIISVADTNAIGLKSDDIKGMRELTASLNGEIKKAFGDNFDQFNEWMKNSKTKGESLNKIKLDDFKEMIKGREVEFANSLKANTFTKMWGGGEGYNEPIMKEMRRLFLAHRPNDESAMLKGNQKARNVWNSLA